MVLTHRQERHLKLIIVLFKEELTVEEISQSSMENLNIIKSPMVGTVYLSPSPEEPTFIHVGKKDKKRRYNFNY